MYHVREQEGERFSNRWCSKKTHAWQKSYFYEDGRWVRGVWKILWFFKAVWGETKGAGEDCTGNLVSEGTSDCWRKREKRGGLKRLGRLRRRLVGLIRMGIRRGREGERRKVDWISKKAKG